MVRLPLSSTKHAHCAVCPFLALNLVRSTPLKLILLTNKRPWLSSPQAPIIPVDIPKPAESPRIVLATLPPAIVVIGERLSRE
uniref:Uncharacterized protein n=1 Tax=Arundo donax TaxID=35708 RepID=A0A0A9GNT2_ARUDO